MRVIFKLYIVLEITILYDDSSTVNIKVLSRSTFGIEQYNTTLVYTKEPKIRNEIA